MDKELEFENIDASKFEFVQENSVIHDTKLDTKPIGYFKDALIRFRKNKSSVVAFVIIVILGLFALFGPFLTKHTTTEQNGYYRFCLPKSRVFSWAGWDGCKTQNSITQAGYDSLMGVYAEDIGDRNNTNSKAVRKDYGARYDDARNKFYTLKVDSYTQVGFEYLDLSPYEYFQLQAYQDKYNIQVIYPMISTAYVDSNADNWYVTKDYQKLLYLQVNASQEAGTVYSTEAKRDANGNYVANYEGTLSKYNLDYHSLRLPKEYDNNGNLVAQYAYKTYEGINQIKLPGKSTTYEYVGEQDLTGYYSYAMASKTGYRVRILVNEYYRYQKTTKKYGTYTKSYQAKEYFDTEWAKINSTYVNDYDNENRVQALNELASKFTFKNDGYYCNFIFGSNDKGKDIFVMLASGARLSFILAICVSIINLTIGAFYGAIEGYYGGAVDLIMERISDILNDVPFIVVATLFNLHLQQKVGALGSLLFAFVLTGWLGMAARTRMQFYRFKSQEYVLSARTLGARDARIMFKHIFPNAIGTLITGSVLAIPGVIFSESSLSYLHIIDLETSGFTSVGTLLSNGTSYVSNYPHVVVPPAVFIALLMISFNLFGNGLRDAFNPSLRGVDE